MTNQIAATILHFSQVIISGFGSLTKICAWKVIIKAIASYIFEKPNWYVLVSKYQDNFLIINSKNVLGKLLLLLQMMILGFLKYMVLEIEIN